MYSYFSSHELSWHEYSNPSSSMFAKTSNKSVAECLCDATSVNKFIYEWTIPRFGYRNEQRGQFVQSDPFPKDCLLKWCVRAFPKGRTGGISTNYSYLELDIVSFGISKVRANFQFSILDRNRVKHLSYRTPTYIFTEHKRSVAVEQFVRLEHILNITDGELVIICEVRVMTGIWKIFDQPNIEQSKVPENKLSEDFGTLLDNEKFSDVKLVASGRELKAHKAILAVRSKVFAAMFEHEMEEQNMNRVTITDVDHEVLKEMVRYMYTDTAPNLDTMAEDLFVAADKYDIENLKLMCEVSLRTNISIEKAVNTLILADRHNAEQLKSQTIAFIIRNATRVMETQGWKDLRTTGLHLFEDLFCTIVQKFEMYSDET